MNLYQHDLPSDVIFENSVAIDTEAMGLKTGRDRLCLVQMCSAAGDVHIVQIHKNGPKPENLKKMLRNPSVSKIFHFARFDVTLLNYTFGIEVAPIYCTKIASKLVRTYTDKHGLKNLVKDVLGVEISKQEQASDWGRETLTEEQLHYAASDVLYLHKLKDELDKMLHREEKFDLAQQCFKGIELISRLELAGYIPEELFQY